MTLTTWQFTEVLFQNFWWVLVLAVAFMFAAPLTDLIGILVEDAKEYFKRWRRRRKTTRVEVVQGPSVESLLIVHTN